MNKTSKPLNTLISAAAFSALLSALVSLNAFAQEPETEVAIAAAAAAAGPVSQARSWLKLSGMKS